MLTEFLVRNALGFRDFYVEKLARVNLFTGRNNVGKTTLLRAIQREYAPEAIWPQASPHEDGCRFKKVVEFGHYGEVLDALRSIEPRIRCLGVQFGIEGYVMCADLGLCGLVPIAGGMSRLTSIMLAILTNPGCIVLIDEFESGFHYSVLRDVWMAVVNAAKRSDTQLFMTTHSWECVKAAHEVFREMGDRDALCVCRLERRGEKIVPIMYDEQAIDSAFEYGLEMR